jgi:PAS domain-containing protein
VTTACLGESRLRAQARLEAALAEAKEAASRAEEEAIQAQEQAARAKEERIRAEDQASRTEQIALEAEAAVASQKEAEAALRESEERYRAFIEQTAEGVWRFELEQPVPVDLPPEEQIERFYAHAFLAECNDAAAHMYGFGRAAELIGARLSDMMPRTDPHNLEYLQAFVRSGYRLTDAESHEHDREGHERYFLNNLIGIVSDGHILRAWGSQRDVTASRQSENAIQVSEARFRSVFDSGMIGIAFWNGERSTAQNSGLHQERPG